MKSYITLITAVILLTSLTACSERNSITPGSTTSGIVFQTNQNATEPQLLEAAISNALGDGYYCTSPVSEEELALSIFNGLNLSKVESYVAKQTAESDAGKDMVAIFKCKRGYANQLPAILNSYYAQVVSNTMQSRHDVLKVNGTRIYRIGDTVMFILAGRSPKNGISTDEEAALAEAEYAKIDRAIKKLYGTVPENLAEIAMDPSWARSL